jgi:hypothetical protein
MLSSMVMCLSAAFASVTPSVAADPASDSTADAELAAMKTANEKPQTALALEKAEDDILRARIGQLSTTGLSEGKVDATSLSTRPSLIAYQSAACVAGSIATRISTHGAHTVMRNTGRST